MSSKLSIQNITSGYRPIQSGKQFEQFFGLPDDKDRVIIEDGEVDDTVDLMKKVVWKYLPDTKKIAAYLKGKTTEETSRNIWNFLYNHIQYKLDKRGLEQIRRPNRSWADRADGIDCDCFSVFVSSILTNLQIPHKFRIAKYDQDVFQHVYVTVPAGNGKEYIIDCVLSLFNYEKLYKEKKDFTMNLNGINVAVLSGHSPDVMDLVNDLEGIETLGNEPGHDNQERLQAIYAHLVKTRTLIAAKPHLIADVDYPPAFLKMLDYAIENWNTLKRDKALLILAQNEEALNRHLGMDGIPENSDEEGLDNDWDHLDENTDDVLLGKLFKRKTAEEKAQKKSEKKEKKAARQQKKEQKKSQPKKKGFFKKVGEAVKKGGKAFVRYNPVSVSARNGFLLAMKMNIKQMASKLKWGYATKEQAAAKGVNADTWQRSKNALTKVEVLFADKLQGKRDKLKDAILKGKAGGLSGTGEEYELGELGAVAAAAALAAATPVIVATVKIISDSGLFAKGEGENVEMEINSRLSEAEEAFNDPELRDEILDDQSGDSDSESEEGGFIGFVKKNPLLAAGGAGLAIWGLSKVFSGSKKQPARSKSLGSAPKSKAKKAAPKSKSKARSRKAKIEIIRLS